MDWSFDQPGSYCLEASLCWLFFYGLYLVLFKDLTFFSINRWYLVLTFLLGLLIPSFNIPVQTSETTGLIIGAQLPEIRITATNPAAANMAADASAFDLTGLLWAVYWIGVLIAVVKVGLEFFKIYRLWYSAERIEQNGYTLALTEEGHFPFSFMRTLFWSREYLPEAADAAHIEQHELAHIRQLHSLDILLVELVGIFLWFNPFIYWYKRSLKTVHEYLADAAVLQQASVRSYGNILLKHAQSGQHYALTHGLIPSQLKQRILMMTKTNSPKQSLLKYALAVPVLILFVLAFSFQATFAEGTNNTEVPANTTEIALDTIPEEVFQVVDEMPRFPGCEEAEAIEACAQKKMLEYIYSNLKYPADAREGGHQGTVVAKFVVGANGEILTIDIKRSVFPSIDAEVSRVIESMPNWVPGKQDGKNVAVEMVLPIKFKLDEDDQKRADVDQIPALWGTCPSGDLNLEAQQACSAKSLVEYMVAELTYPESAKKKGIEGKVLVSFVIDTNGEPTDIKILQSLDPSCDAEVIRLIRAMPNWYPAQKEGNPVRMELKLPFVFQLGVEEKAANPVTRLTVQGFKAYPNPAQDVLNVSFEASKSVTTTVELTDLNGRVQTQHKFTDFSGQANVDFELDGLAPGTYLVVIRQGEKVFAERVQVQ